MVLHISKNGQMVTVTTATRAAMYLAICRLHAQIAAAKVAAACGDELAEAI